MENCVLLSARKYAFKGEDGTPVSGVSFEYVTGDAVTGPDEAGCSVLRITGPVEAFAHVQAVPGLYTMDFKQRPGKGGRPTLQLVGLKLLKDLRPVFTSVSQGVGV